jgi:hypothetical protein
MRENHPRERRRAQLERKRPTRTEFPRILIVCEGEKTERQYFEGLRQSYRIPTVELRVEPSRIGTAPSQVVETAEGFAKQGSWEEVWCVFDRDDHPSFVAAIEKAKVIQEQLRKKLGQGFIFRAAPSVPCFELWYLIHFEEQTRAEESATILEKLRAWIPNYDKGLPGLWNRLEPTVAMAIDRAEGLRGRAVRNGNLNPSTEVDQLVKHLIGMRKKG